MSTARKHGNEGSTGAAGGGETVLDLRARLGQVLRRAAEEGERLGLEGDKSAALLRLGEAAREPFLLVIAGEVNSGKSTFVNAFFREEVTQADVLPATEQVLWFRYGEAGDEPWHSGVVIRRRPLAFLQDFHVVDTPGTNSVVAGHDAVTEDFLPMADLVVVVLPVTNPWAASAWGFLERLHRVWLKRVVVVLQQADLLEPEAVATVASHVRGRLHATFGEVFPLFPVSARLALQAQRTADAGERRRIWESSGFSAVETYLRERVGRFESRLLKMRNTVEAALSIVRKLSGIEVPVEVKPEVPATEADDAGREAEEKLVQEIDERIDREERLAEAAAGELIEPLMQRWREMEVILPPMVEERLGIFATIRAMLTGERTPLRVGRRLRGSMGEAAESTRAALQAALVGRGKSAWESLRAHLADEYQFPLRLDTPDGDPDFTDWAAAATQDLPGRIAEAVADCPMEAQLRAMLGRRVTYLRLLAAGVVVMAGAGAWAWTAGMPLPSVLAAVVAAVSGILGTAVWALQSVQPAVEAAGKALEARREKLREAGLAAVGLAAHRFFRRLTEVFNPIRRMHLGEKEAGGANPFGAIRRELESIGGVIDSWAMAENGENSELSGRPASG